MASLTTDPGDRKRITIEMPDGSRKTIRLGKVPDRTANDYRDNIEHLLANRNTPHLIATKVLEWANGLDETVYERIARVGLLPPRKPEVAAILTLDEFLEKWSSAQTFKPNTEIFYRNTKRLLVAFFGKDRDIVGIRAEDADAFKAYMANEHHLSAATVGRRIGAARTMWKAAIRWELVSRNPFDGIPVGTQSNAARKRFVPRDIIAKVIDAAPDAEWRLIIALSRYAGLRCPSEHYALTWRDINWEAGTIMVNCPKLARNPKFARRLIPLFADLRPYLMQVFEEAEEGAEYVIAQHRLASVNLRTQFLRIIHAAGVTSWPRLFHNLRV